VLLGAAAISIAISSLTFGAPSAIVFAAIVGRIGWTKKQGVRLVTQPILVLAAILALIGFIAGTIVSKYWHFSSLSD
jgi:multisubunit Na+/H+ antiporter MnhF subunit